MAGQSDDGLQEQLMLVFALEEWEWDMGAALAGTGGLNIEGLCGSLWPRGQTDLGLASGAALQSWKERCELHSAANCQTHGISADSSFTEYRAMRQY